MKRLASLLTVLLLALGLVGCGSDEKQQDNGVKILPKPTQQTLSIESIEKLHDGLLGDLSPDGTKLLFAWDQGKPDENPQDEMAALRSLHLLNMTDGSVEQISHSEIHQGNGRFSPDGKHIAFTENAEESFRAYVMANKPNAPKKMVSKPGEIIDPIITWSPDGSTFAVAHQLSTPGKIVLYDAQGNEKHSYNLNEGIARLPQFVDQDSLLYVSIIGDSAKIMALDVNDHAGGVNENVTGSNSELPSVLVADRELGFKVKEVVPGSNFELSPDKRNLAYLVPNGDGNYKIKIDAIDNDLKVGATLAETELRDGSSVLAWSPDNQYLLYSDEGNIWALNTKDGTKKQLVSDMFNITRMIWDIKEGIIFTGIPKEAEKSGDYSFSTYRIKLK